MRRCRSRGPSAAQGTLKRERGDTRMDDGKIHADASWDEHYADERDAAWLYRELARVDSNTDRGALFGRLAGVEDQHTARWEQLFREAGRPLPAYDVSRRT